MSGRKTWWNVLKKEKDDEDDEDTDWDTHLDEPTDEEKEREWESDEDIQDLSFQEDEDEEKAGWSDYTEDEQAENPMLASLMRDANKKAAKLLENRAKKESQLSDAKGDKYEKLKRDIEGIDLGLDSLLSESQRVSRLTGAIVKEEPALTQPDWAYGDNPDDKEATAEENFVAMMGETMRSDKSISKIQKDLLIGTFLLRANDLVDVIHSRKKITEDGKEEKGGEEPEEEVEDDTQGMRHRWKDPQGQLRNYLWRHNKLFKIGTRPDGRADYVARETISDEEKERHENLLKKERDHAMKIVSKIAHDIGVDADYLLNEMTYILPFYLTDPTVTRGIGAHEGEFDELDWKEKYNKVQNARNQTVEGSAERKQFDVELKRLNLQRSREVDERQSAINKGLNKLYWSLTNAMQALEMRVIGPVQAYRKYKDNETMTQLFRSVISDGNIPNRSGYAPGLFEEDKGKGYHGHISYPPQAFNPVYYKKGNWLDWEELLDTEGACLDDMQMQLNLDDSFNRSHFIADLRDACANKAPPTYVDEDGITQFPVETEEQKEMKQKRVRAILDSVMVEDNDGDFSFNPDMVKCLFSSFSQRHGGGCTCGQCENNAANMITSQATNYRMDHPTYDVVNLAGRGIRALADAFTHAQRADLAHGVHDVRESQKRAIELRAEARALAKEGYMEEAQNKFRAATKIEDSLQAREIASEIDDAPELSEGAPLPDEWYATPPTDVDLAKTSQGMMEELGLVRGQLVRGGRQVRPVMRHPYGWAEKRIQAIFSQLGEDEEGTWRDYDETSRDYSDRIEWVEWALRYIEEMQGAKGAWWQSERGLTEGLGTWLESKTDLYSRLTTMQDVLTECITLPTYSFEGGEQVKTGEVQGYLTKNGDFKEGYGPLMRKLSKLTKTEPEELLRLLSDESDTGVIGEHVLGVTLFDQISRITAHRPQVYGEEWSHIYEEDESSRMGSGALGIQHEKSPLPGELLWEPEMLEPVKDTSGRKEKWKTEGDEFFYNEATGSWEQKQKRVVRALPGTMGGESGYMTTRSGPAHRETLQTKRHRRDYATAVTPEGLRVNRRKWYWRKIDGKFTRVWADGSPVLDPPHIGRNNYIMDKSAFQKVRDNASTFNKSLTTRMENVEGTPTPHTIGNIQPYEMFPLMALALQHGLPHHIDANEGLTDDQKKYFKNILSQAMEGSSLYLHYMVHDNPDFQSEEEDQDTHFLQREDSFQDYVRAAWRLLAHDKGLMNWPDPFARVADRTGVDIPVYSTRAFQNDTNASQFWDQICYDVIDDMVNPKSRGEKIRKVFGAYKEGGKMKYDVGEQNRFNVTAGKSRCSGPVGLSCGGDGYINYEGIRRLLILRGEIAGKITGPELQEYLKSQLDEGKIKHYGDHSDWNKQAMREARFLGIPLKNAGVTTIRYSCPFCDGYGVCGGCEGTKVESMPASLEEPYRAGMDAIARLYDESVQRNIAKLYPDSNAITVPDQSLQTFCEENGFDDILEGRLPDVFGPREAPHEEPSREMREPSKIPPMPEREIGHNAVEEPSLTDPSQRVSAAKAAVASSKGGGRWTEGELDDEGNEKEPGWVFDNRDSPWYKTLQDDARHRSYNFRTGEEIVKKEEIRKMKNVLAEWESKRDALRILESQMEEIKSKNPDCQACQANSCNKHQTSQIISKNRIKVAIGQMQGQSDTLYDLGIYGDGVTTKILNRAISELRRAHDLMTGGDLEQMHSFQARVLYKMEQARIDGEKERPKREYAGNYKYAKDEVENLDEGFRYKRSDKPRYVWNASLSGYQLPPWDNNTEVALMQSDRVFNLMVLLEELRSLKMHDPQYAGDLKKWRQGIDTANLATQQIINAKKKELEFLESDDWVNEYADMDETHWRADLRRNYMIQSLKEHIGVLQEYKDIRESKRSKKAYQEMLGKEDKSDWGVSRPLTNTNHWEAAEQSFYDYMREILYNTSTFFAGLYREDYRERGEARKKIVDEGGPSYRDWSWPFAEPSSIEELQELITRESNELNQFFKEAPFDYETNLQEEIEEARKAYETLKTASCSCGTCSHGLTEGRQKLSPDIATIREQIDETMDIDGDIDQEFLRAAQAKCPIRKAMNVKHNTRYTILEPGLAEEENGDKIWLDNASVFTRGGDIDLIEHGRNSLKKKLSDKLPPSFARTERNKILKLHDEQVWLENTRERMQRFLAPLYHLSKNGTKLTDAEGKPLLAEEMSPHEIAFFASQQFSEVGRGPSWLYNLLSQMQAIEDADGEEIPWSLDGMFDEYNNRKGIMSPLSYLVKVMQYDDAWHERYEELQQQKEEVTDPSELAEIEEKEAAMLGEEKTSVKSSGYAYHPALSSGKPWPTKGQDLMDSYGYEIVDKYADNLQFQSEEEPDPLTELRMKAVSMDLNDENETDPFHTLSFALALLEGSPIERLPSGIMDNGEIDEHFVRFDCPQGPVLDALQQRVNKKYLNRWTRLGAIAPNMLMRMIYNGFLNAGPEQYGALADTIARTNLGFDFNNETLKDAEFWLGTPQSEEDIKEREKELQEYHKERRRIQRHLDVAENSDEVAHLSDMLDSHLNDFLLKTGTIAGGVEVARQMENLPSYTLDPSEILPEPVQNVLDNLDKRNAMDDDEKEEYPTLSTPRTLPRWVDSEAPGRDSVPQTPGTRIIGGERLLERTPLSEWKREQLMGDGSELREGVSEEEAQEALSEIDDTVSQLTSSKTSPTFKPEGEATATRMSREAREQTVPEPDIDRPPPVTAASDPYLRRVERSARDARKVYEGLDNIDFVSQGRIDAAGTGPPPWDERMARRPSRPDEDDDAVATSSDSPLDFAFRILKNIV